MTSLAIAFAVLVLSTALLHVLLWGRKDKDIWAGVDYASVGLAAIGVFGVLAEARQTLASRTLWQVEGPYGAILSSTRTWAQSVANCYQTTHERALHVWESTPDTVELTRTCRSAADWFQRIADSLETSKEPHKWGELAETSPDIGTGGAEPFTQGLTGELRRDVERMKKRLREIVELRAAFDDRKKAMGKYEYEVLVALVNPWTFFMAIALQATKVTAQARWLR